MPERTPNLHAANLPFHKEVRNQPRRGGAPRRTRRRSLPARPPALRRAAVPCRSYETGHYRAPWYPGAKNDRIRTTFGRSPETPTAATSLRQGPLDPCPCHSPLHVRSAGSRTRGAPHPLPRPGLTSPAGDTPPGSGPPGPPRPPSPPGGRRRSTCAGRPGRHARGHRRGTTAPRRDRGGRRPPR